MGINELIEDYKNGKVVVDSLSKEELPQEFKTMTKEEIRLSLDKSVQQRKANIEKLKVVLSAPENVKVTAQFLVKICNVRSKKLLQNLREDLCLTFE